MGWSRQLTAEELILARVYVEGTYPERNIIAIVGERREHRPSDEGLDLGTLAMAMLKKYADPKTQLGVSSGALDYWLDSYLVATDPSNGWIVTGTALEKLSEDA